MSEHCTSANLVTTAVAVPEMWSGNQKDKNGHKCARKIFIFATTSEYVLYVAPDDMSKIRKIQIQQKFLFTNSWFSPI